MELKPNQVIAQEILDGKWGNGTERRERLTKAGYNYEKVQSIVNALVYGDPIPEDEPQNKPLEIRTGIRTAGRTGTKGKR